MDNKRSNRSKNNNNNNNNNNNKYHNKYHNKRIILLIMNYIIHQHADQRTIAQEQLRTRRRHRHHREDRDENINFDIRSFENERPEQKISTIHWTINNKLIKDQDNNDNDDYQSPRVIKIYHQLPRVKVTTMYNKNEFMVESVYLSRTHAKTRVCYHNNKKNYTTPNKNPKKQHQ